MKKARLLILVLLALLSNNVQGGNVVLLEETFADGLLLLIASVKKIGWEKCKV